MRLIYIANSRIPTEEAHGIQIIKMCEAFASCDTNLRMNTDDRNNTDRSNFEVELVIPKRFNLIKKDPFRYYGIKRNFKIKKLPCLDLIPLNRYLGRVAFWIQSLSFSFSVWIYILFKKTDIIYTRSKFVLFLALFKKNIFFEAHTFPQNYFLYAPYLKKLKGIIVITETLKDLFFKKGTSRNKLLVAPDGVDLEMFNIKQSRGECRRRLNLPQNQKIVLYTGHLYQWKGSTTLLQAAWKSETRNPKPKILFVFVGGTKEDVKGFRFQTSHFSLRNILVMEHRPYGEIPLWLKAADVLVLPNSEKAEISKFWTSPLKVFEYMASNRPIVASDLPSIREVLGQKNAILVPPDNPEALAQAIKKILDNYKVAFEVATQAFKDVRNYTWEKRIQRISKFIFRRIRR